MICPECNGDGGRQFIACKQDAHACLQWMDCLLCGGTGRITEERSKLVAKGARLRLERIGRCEAILEASRRLGISTAELCAIEAGRASPEVYDRLLND